ncbi:MAG: PhoH family protein [Ichthyobacteriaceae bacterium]|nr:PhoH family protein [Ichthyobacteriaceae bacterium]
MSPIRNDSVKLPKKIFVLDTSVIIFDHECLSKFEENDVVIPITVLDELDDFKKGRDVKNFAAREFIRFLDDISETNSLRDWVEIPGENKGAFKIILDTDKCHVDAQEVFIQDKNDHRILNAALCMQMYEPDRKVILVTKDINLRLKARALNVQSEDYETGKIKEVDKLTVGVQKEVLVPSERIDLIYAKKLVDKELIPEIPNPVANEYCILKGPTSSALVYYNPETSQFEKVDKKLSYGIRPRNVEQTFALHALTKEHIKLVALQGVAGTGKTLLALAGALDQRREFKQIFLARPIVPLSNKDLGFLPGDVSAKVTPYMEPLWDNLKFIKNQYADQDKEYKQIDNMVETEKLIITPLAYIRGRSLSDVIFIVDEAQNLTPHEVKTIITRAGKNAKFIFTGDIRQIDTPYLDDKSNGLSYLIDKLSGNDLFAHVELVKGERSALANLANRLL